MDLLVETVDTINRFVLGLLFYFLVFGILLFIPNFIIDGIFHADPVKDETIFIVISVLITIPLGIYINRRFISQGKSKFLKNFFLVLQAIFFCIGVGFAIYMLFLLELDSLRPF